MKVPTIYEMYHPELIEREPLNVDYKAMKIRKIKDRIKTMEGRKPVSSNQAIVKKLKRELKRLENME